MARRFELTKPFAPMGRSLCLARRLIKLHNSLQRFLQADTARGPRVTRLLLHTLVALNEQRLRFGVLILPEKTDAHDDVGLRAAPRAWKVVFIFAEGEQLLPEDFGLTEFAGV